MHEMETIVADDPVAWCVGLKVCHVLRPAKRLNGSRSSSFAPETLGSPENSRCSRWGPNLAMARGGHSMRRSPSYFGHLLTKRA